MLRATVAFSVADADACSFHSIWEASCLFTPGLTILFSLQIPVFSGNKISFRNFGKFRRILAEIFWILNFQTKFSENTEFFFPVTSENENFCRISAKFRRNFKPCCLPMGHTSNKHRRCPSNIFSSPAAVSDPNPAPCRCLVGRLPPPLPVGGAPSWLLRWLPSLTAHFPVIEKDAHHVHRNFKKMYAQQTTSTTSPQHMLNKCITAATQNLPNARASPAVTTHPIQQPFSSVPQKNVWCLRSNLSGVHRFRTRDTLIHGGPKLW